MSQPWSYYNSAPYGYNYYPNYGYPPQNMTGDGASQSTEGTYSSQAGAEQPTSQSAVPAYTIPAVAGLPPQAAYGVYNAYMQRAGYASDPALDAAQRWNAMNCPYYNACAQNPPVRSGVNSATVNGTHAVGTSAPTQMPTNSVSGASSAETVGSSLNDVGGGLSKWSPELKDYVKRAFLKAETSIEKDQMERILKSKIEYVFRNGVSVDWKTEPLPVIPKCLAAQPKANTSSINVARPVPIQPWKTRGRNAVGALPTGTLARNQQQTSLQTGLAAKTGNLIQKPSVVSSSNSSPEPKSSVTPKFPEVAKRQRFVRRRSRSSSSSSASRSNSSSSYRQSRVGKKRKSRSPPAKCNYKRRKHSPDSDRDHVERNGTNSGTSNDAAQVSQNAKQGRKKKRNGKGGVGSPLTNEPGNNASKDNQGGKRGGARGRGSKAAGNSRWTAPDTSLTRLSQRADRFKDHLGVGSIARSTKQMNLFSNAGNFDFLCDRMEEFNIVGTMQELEKPYLRLTSAPDPANVRPPEVLEKSLAHVRKRWSEKSDYLWVCEQFKSIRQDLTVQRIHTELTAEVYEAHADIALEAGDSQEFNQCQSQLTNLHSKGLGSARRLEFMAYRILYYIFTQDLLGMSSLLLSLSKEEKQNPFIRFAQAVRQAWALRSYRRFFNLAINPDAAASFETETCKLHGCRQILSWALDRERVWALKAMFRAYRQTLKVGFIANTLGFKSDAECADFIVNELGVDVRGVETLDCKDIWSRICATAAST